MRFLVGVVAIMSILVGCGNEPPLPELNQDIEGAVTWRTGILQEEIRIDGYENDLVPIGFVAIRSDGAVAITQSQDSQVRFFNRSGRPLGNFGREGDGPGEFGRSVGRMGWMGDTLWVADGAHQRLIRISPAFELLEVRPETPPQVLALSLAGELFSVSSFLEEGDSWISAVNSASNEPRMIVRIPPSEGVGARIQNGMMVGLPFGNSPQYAVALDGDPIGTAMASLEGPDAETYLLTAVSMEGDTIFSNRIPFEGEPIPKEVGEKEVEKRVTLLSSYPAGSLPSEAIEEVRNTHIPPFFPPLTGLRIGNDGTYWIEFREREGRRLYHVISPEGGRIGTILLPERSQIKAAQMSHVWTVEADEVGVETLVRYAVIWG